MNQREHNVCIIRLLEEGYSLRKLEKAVIQARVDWAEICDERDAEREIDFLLSVLKDIGDFAHDRSTGPAVEDDLWEVRRMAYEALTHNAGIQRRALARPLECRVIPLLTTENEDGNVQKETSCD